MVVPFLVATALGGVVGAAVRPLEPVRRSRPRRVLVGVVGAWAGFAVLALGGVVVDAVAGAASYALVLGYGGAVLGALAAARS